MRKRSHDRGFTLVELLVAVVLLATGLTAAATAFSAAARAQGAAQRRTTEARLAEVKLSEIQVMGTTSGADEGTFAELDAGQAPVAGDLGDYHYRWEVASSDLQGLARAQVSVWYRDNERDQFTLVWYPVSP
jgi:prepilin-type N-terminal cleavage/methylation domain-containing protein